jgi:hypothetical protein
VGLPFGLLIMGALSFVFYFHKRNAAREIQPSRYSLAMRKELNLEEYRRYLKVLDQDIGPRTSGQPGNIEAAQSFIQSTLGFDNMGFDLERRELGKNVAFEAALPAAKFPHELVIVCARYDGVHGESLATLFCLAHSLTGSTQRNSLRFFAFEQLDATASDKSAVAPILYRDWNPKGEFDRVLTVFITNPGDASPTATSNTVALPSPSAADPAALKTLKDNQAVIEKYANAPLPK